MTDFDTYTARYERHRQATAKANELNQAILFDALAAAGITAITIQFDGCGDSGQIESISAYMGEAPKALPAPAAVEPPEAETPSVAAVPLPQTPVTLYHAKWDSDELGTDEITLQDAIEALCYDYLEQEHDGWMDNDGAFGEFEFDVALRTIHLEFNGRFTDVYTHTHTF
jgi:hypothetical protein